VFEPLDIMGVAQTGDHGGNVQGRVFQVDKPLLGHHLRPLQLQILYSMGSRKRPGQRMTFSGFVYWSTADFLAKTDLTLSLTAFFVCIISRQ
jgi:hypothetical protein